MKPLFFTPILLLLFCYTPTPTPGMPKPPEHRNSVNFAGTSQAPLLGQASCQGQSNKVEEHLTPKPDMSLTWSTRVWPQRAHAIWGGPAQEQSGGLLGGGDNQAGPESIRR